MGQLDHSADSAVLVDCKQSADVLLHATRTATRPSPKAGSLVFTIFTIFYSVYFLIFTSRLDRASYGSRIPWDCSRKMSIQVFGIHSM